MLRCRGKRDDQEKSEDVTEQCPEKRARDGIMPVNDVVGKVGKRK
jgi:hypothetical protein